MSLSTKLVSPDSLSESPRRMQTTPSMLAVQEQTKAMARFVSSESALCDQFEDAPEETSPSPPFPVRLNPLDALALACAVENRMQREENTMVQSTAIEPDVAMSNPHAFPISQNDVLCGRGGLTNHHPGNVFFRRLVRLKQELYLLASKREKAGVAKEIVGIIRLLDPPGRFLKKDPTDPAVWIEIGDRKAREKTSQALREGAPELREELQTTDQLPPHEVVLTATVSNGARATLDSLRKQAFKPDTHWSEQSSGSMTENKPGEVINNRARVVSDDAGVLGIRPLFHQHQGQHPHIVMDELSAFPHTHHHHPQPFYVPYPGQGHVVSHRFPVHRNQQTFVDTGTFSVGGPPKVGAKRKVDTSCITQQGRYNQESTAKRGPRLQLLKSRRNEASI